MKEHLIVTISDINGSKQYTVHEVVKKVIFWIVLLVIAIIIMTYFYITTIHKKVSQLSTKMAYMKQETLVLTKTNKILLSKNKNLKDDINESGDKLQLMNTKLSEIEEMVGVGPDKSLGFEERVNEAKDFHQKQLQKEKISALQRSFLMHNIPNGKFLDSNRISSEFGYRIHPVTKKRDFHWGLDLTAETGTPIYAPADGVVEYAEPKGAYGNFLLIGHNYGFKTAYGHLSKFAVNYGDYVSKGDVVGYVGSTGRSTGSHLHYELRYLNKWLDPKLFIEWDGKDFNAIYGSENKVNWIGILKQIQSYNNLMKL